MRDSGYAGARSLGGGALKGDRLLRVAYLDEAGASRAEDEPYFVVAGIILSPDGQWNEVEAWIRALVIDELGEEGIRPWGRHYAFHAKDIWHGSGDFPRNTWPRERRHKLFEKMSTVPAAFNLPIVYDCINKEKFFKLMKHRNVPKKLWNGQLHSKAFFRAARRIDQWMIENTKDEVIMLIAENVDTAKAIDQMHALYVDRSIERTPGAFQAERIIEQVSFMRKDQSGILQLADWCSFIIKRRMQGCNKIAPYFSNIEKQIFHRHRVEQGLIFIAHTDDLTLVEGE